VQTPTFSPPRKVPPFSLLSYQRSISCTLLCEQVRAFFWVTQPYI
jgi:hypothetical protein